MSFTSTPLIFSYSPQGSLQMGSIFNYQDLSPVLSVQLKCSVFLYQPSWSAASQQLEITFESDQT
uniref:Uncharacterized protein n=1 Tax=Anguilla anguilla TaxID=7936 RepID=A0A0E9S8A4_ANGAN